MGFKKKKIIISFLKIKWTFIYEKWMPFTQSCIAPSLVGICQEVCRRGSLNVIDVFWSSRYNLRLKNDWVLHLKKVWLKLVQLFWRRKSLNLVKGFLLFSYYLPLKKAGPSFEQSWNPLTQGCVVSSLFFKIDLGEENKKCERFTVQQTDGKMVRRTTDNRRPE